MSAWQLPSKYRVVEIVEQRHQRSCVLALCVKRESRADGDVRVVRRSPRCSARRSGSKRDRHARRSLTRAVDHARRCIQEHVMDARMENVVLQRVRDDRVPVVGDRKHDRARPGMSCLQPAARVPDERLVHEQLRRSGLGNKSASCALSRSGTRIAAASMGGGCDRDVRAMVATCQQRQLRDQARSQPMIELGEAAFRALMRRVSPSGVGDRSQRVKEPHVSCGLIQPHEGWGRLHLNSRWGSVVSVTLVTQGRKSLTGGHTLNCSGPRDAFGPLGQSGSLAACVSFAPTQERLRVEDEAELGRHRELGPPAWRELLRRVDLHPRRPSTSAFLGLAVGCPTSCATSMETIGLVSDDHDSLAAGRSRAP